MLFRNTHQFSRVPGLSFNHLCFPINYSSGRRKIFHLPPGSNDYYILLNNLCVTNFGWSMPLRGNKMTDTGIEYGYKIQNPDGLHG